MDEEERNKKLKAGKEKLAAFQKKKIKKKHHNDRTGNHSNTEPVESSSVEQSSSSEVPFFDDSDQLLTSEDEMETKDTKTLFKVETKLKHATERIAELEESLEGKQLALNRVLDENVKLKEGATQPKLVEMETALSKRDEIIRQLTGRLQSASSLESETELLTQHVQQLQTQLINAGKLMEAQNSKQMMSSQALIEAKNEIESLQSCLLSKDSLLNQLSDKVTAISSEYTSLKSSYESIKMNSENGGDVRQGTETGVDSKQTHDSEVKVQELRLELEENYGNQISMMKEELLKQHVTERDSLNSEISRLQQKCSELETAREKYFEESNSSQNDSKSQMDMDDLKTRIAEIEKEKDRLVEENLSLSSQLTEIQEKLTLIQKSVPVTTVDDGASKHEESEIVGELQKTNAALLSELETYKNDLEETKRQMSQQRAKGSAKFQVDSQEIVMELKQVTEQYEEALVNIALMKGKIEDYDIKCEDLTNDLEKLQKKLELSDELVQDYEERMKEFEAMSGDLAKAKGEVKNLNEKVENYEAQIRDFNQEVLEWKEKYSEAEKLVKDSESRVLELTDELETVRKQSDEYRDKFVDYEQQLTDYEGLMTQFNELQHECSVYRAQNDELNNKMNIQQDVVMELKAELQMLANQNQMFQEQSLLQTQCVEKLTLENKSLEEVVDLHKSQVDELTHALSQSTEEVKLYQEKAISLESSVALLEAELKDKDSVEKINEKDVIIENLSKEVSELNAQLRVLESEGMFYQKESITREESKPVNTSNSDNDTSGMAYFNEHLENKIEESVATTLTLEFLSQSADGQNQSIINQSNDGLQNQMVTQIEREIDADSLDGRESTHTLDSLEPVKDNDLSHQLSEKNALILSLRNEISQLRAESKAEENDQSVELLRSQISDLEDQNKKLENWNADLINQINDLTLKAEKQNSTLCESLESSEEDTLVQTFRMQIDSLHEEKSKLAESNVLLEKSVCDQNETLKSNEAMLATLEREKLALHNELTLVNEAIDQLSQDIGTLETQELESEEMSLEETLSSTMCNKLKLFHQKMTSNVGDSEHLRNECEKEKSEKIEIQEKLTAVLLENDSLTAIIKELENEKHGEDQRLSSGTVNDDLNQAHVEINQLKHSLEEANEREQVLQNQVLRLSEQVSHLSAINQAVSGDKENLENRFVEASNVDIPASVSANQIPSEIIHEESQNWDAMDAMNMMNITEPHDSSSTNQQSLTVSEPVIENIQSEKTDMVEAMADRVQRLTADEMVDTSEDHIMVEQGVGMSDLTNEKPCVSVENSGSNLHAENTPFQKSDDTVTGDKCLLDQIKAIEEENTQLRGKLSQTQNDWEVRETLENKVVELVSENQKMREEFNKNQELLREEHEMLRTTMDALKESSKAGQLLKDQIETLFTELKTLNLQKQELEGSFETMEAAYHQSQAINEELTHQCEILQKKSVELEQLQILAEDMESRSREKDEKFNLEIENWEKKYESEVIKNREALNKVEIEKENLNIQCKEVLGDKETLQEQLLQMKEKSEKSMENEVKISQQNKDLEEKLAETENQLSSVKETCSDYENQLVQIKELYQELEHESKEFENQSKDLLGIKSQMEATLNEIKSQCSGYQTDLEVTKQKCHELGQDNELLCKKCSDLNEGKENLQSEMNDLKNSYEKDRATMEDTIEQLKSQNTSLQAELTASSEENETLMTLSKEQQEKLDESSYINVKLKQSIQDLQNENKELIDKYRQLEDNKKALNDQYAKLVEDNNSTHEKLRQTVDALSTENANLSEKLDEYEISLREMKEEKESVIMSLKVELDEKTKHLIEQDLRLSQILSEVESNNARYENLHSSQAKLEELSFEYEQLQKLNKQCNEKITSLELENKDLHKKHENVSTHSETLQQSLQEYMEELEQTQKSLMKLQDDNFELKNKKDVLEIENDSMKQQREVLSKEISSLSEELAVVEQERKKFFEEQKLRNEANEEIELHVGSESCDVDAQGSVDITEEINPEDRNKNEQNGENNVMLDEEGCASGDGNIDSHDSIHERGDNSEQGEKGDNCEQVERGDNSEQGEEFVSEEELEALIEQRIEREKKQVEYDLEEKYEVKFRQRQVELMHEFSLKQKDLEKNFEQQVNHRLESLRSEKDKSFVKTLQKVKKDFEKRHQREIEKQRLSHLQEIAKMEDEIRGGGHIKDVVQNLVQENEDLAEARDALLQEVEFSHQQQEQLEDELRNAISQDNRGFVQEPIKLNTQHSRFSQRSESVVLDWEFSPTSSFDHDKDPPDLNSQMNTSCKNPQCRSVLMRYHELQKTVQTSGFHPEDDSNGEFVVFNDEFVKPDELSTPTTELEASFVKEALRKGAESFSKDKQHTTSTTPSVNTFIEHKELNDNVLQHGQRIDHLPSDNKSFIPARCRSLSLNLTQEDTREGEQMCEKNVVRRTKKQLYMKHSRHRSLDEIMTKNSNMEGKFVAEFAHEESQRRKSLSLSMELPTGENSLHELKVQSITHRGTSPFDLFTSERTHYQSDSGDHNSQGEFFEEFISGDLETLPDMAIIKSTATKLEREVTPDSHMENEVFRKELSSEEKLDKEKLLRRLESLKDIYCKEKQDLLSRCESLTIQLENESLSRRQLEQELININEDFSDSLNSRNENAIVTIPLIRETGRSKSEGGSVSDVDLLIDDLRNTVQEKDIQIKKQEAEMRSLKTTLEQKINELKELHKHMVENSALKEIKSSLQNKSKKKGSKNVKSKGTGVDLDSECRSSHDLCPENDNNVVENLNLQIQNLKSEIQAWQAKWKEREEYLNNLEVKFTELRITSEEQADLLATMSQRCEAYENDFDNEGGFSDSEHAEILGVLQEKCYKLEIELEHAKQCEAFTSVYEEKCKQYEMELENRGDCERELEIMTQRYEKLEKLLQEQNANHVKELNSSTHVIEKLRGKCEELNTELDEKCELLQQCEDNCKELQTKLESKEKLLEELNERQENDNCKMDELKTKCSNLTASLKVQKFKNERIQKEADEKFKQYDIEIQHKEKALDEIHETCAKFELAGYENEHVIEELTSQCQKYQSEIQNLRAQELKKMKKTLSCSVDEIEMTDYQEITLDEFTAKYLEEEEKMNRSSGELVVQESIAPTFVSTVETGSIQGADDTSNFGGKISELEALVKDKDSLIKKYKTEVEHLKSQLRKINDFREHHEHIELAMREKDSYIKQLEEHFLQQRSPVSVRSKQDRRTVSDKELLDESRIVAERLASSTPTVEMDGDSSTQEMANDESFSDQSTISGQGSLKHAQSQDSLLSDYEGQLSRSKSNDSLLSDRSENSTQTLHGNVEGSVEMKHFAIVEEISKLRQDLRETKSMYTQENTLLREALDREKWKRETTLEGKNVESKNSSEVEGLRKEVNVLKETNKALGQENDKLMQQIQDQEEIVLQLRKQLNSDSDSNTDETRETFNHQFKLLQKQRNELLEKLHQSEKKVESVTLKMSEKSVSEQSLMQEKALLQAKLYEMEEIENELTEKKIELEKQRARQHQLEEMIYHRDLIERELMKQKRLLEVELAEIECKLREKEELLEIQKNQLLEEIKLNYSSDRIGDTSKLMTSSFDSSDFSFGSEKVMSSVGKVSSTPRSHGVAGSVSSTPRTHSMTSAANVSFSTPLVLQKGKSTSKTKHSGPWKKYRHKGSVNRLELMLSDVEKEHAEAISYLKEKLEEHDKSSSSGGHSRAHSS